MHRRETCGRGSSCASKVSFMVLKCLLVWEDVFYFNERGFIQCSRLRVSVQEPVLVGAFVAGKGAGGCAERLR